MRRGLFSFNVPFLAGNTVITAANQAEIWRPAGMDAWILNCTTEGRGRINRGPGGFLAGRGDLLLFRPEAAHDYGADPALHRWTHLWVYFFPRPEWHELLQWPEAAPGIPRLRVAEDRAWRRIAAGLEEIVAVSRGPLRRREALSQSLLESVLLWCDAANPASASAAVDPRVAEAMGFLCERCREPASIAQLARRAGLSPSRFSHVFREQAGMTPMAWLAKARVRLAREQLVMTGRPIGRIAAELGFASAAHFARVFRRHAGLTPRECRRRGG